MVRSLACFAQRSRALMLSATAKTAHLQPSLPTPVVITIQPDRTFSFTYSTPQTSYLIKKCADVETASGTPGQQGARPAGQLSLKHIFAIAQLKQRDDHMRHVDLQSLCRSIVGAAKSMGVEVVI